MDPLAILKNVIGHNNYTITMRRLSVRKAHCDSSIH